MSSTSCAKCSKPDSLKRCSKCQSTRYCSQECQLADWKSHKKSCQPLEGSDGPKNAQDGKDAANAQPKSPNPATPSQTANPEPILVSGVKLHPKSYSSNTTSRGTRARFVDEQFPPNHPIFTRGELCPFTALYGVPIIIYSPALANGTYGDENQPAVYLRIEANDGLAPVHWQINDPGTCYVIRKDHKPLSKKDIETMYEFHSSILDTDYFVDKMEGNAPYEITPKVFQNFSERYWKRGGL